MILMTNVALNAGSSKQGKADLAARGSNWVAAKYLKQIQIQSNSYWPPTIQGTLPSTRGIKIHMVQSQSLRDPQSTGRDRSRDSGQKHVRVQITSYRWKQSSVGRKGNKFQLEAEDRKETDTKTTEGFKI
jgi:hypothetical protein